MAGAITIFQPTSRNLFGMIGAVDWDAWNEIIFANRLGRNSSKIERYRAERSSGSPASSSPPMMAPSTTSARSWRRSRNFATTCSGTRLGSATTPSILCSRTIAQCASRRSGLRCLDCSRLSRCTSRELAFRKPRKFTSGTSTSEDSVAMSSISASMNCSYECFNITLLPTVRLSGRECQGSRG